MGGVEHLLRRHSHVDHLEVLLEAVPNKDAASVDQLAQLEVDSRKVGTQGQDIDFALLVDGLAAEREQGITIDVAYRYFATPKRKFIIADTPGHEQYTRNMATGASTADLAIILIDARQGVLALFSLARMARGRPILSPALPRRRRRSRRWSRLPGRCRASINIVTPFRKLTNRRCSHPSLRKPGLRHVQTASPNFSVRPSGLR